MNGEDAYLEMAYEDRFEDRVTVLGADSRPERAYEDRVFVPGAPPQFGWIDASFDEWQEYTYEDEQDYDEHEDD